MKENPKNNGKLSGDVREYKEYPTRLVDSPDVRKPIQKKDRNPQPNKKPMFKRIWNTVKSTAVDKIAPFVLDSLEFDFDADKPSGKDYVVIKVSVSFQGRTLFMRQKTIKI